MWKKKNSSQSNKGFSMITVLIAVSFASILGLLVLYIAVSNFRMKLADLHAKDSFYTAEQALEEIRTGLQQDVAESMSAAYQEVMESYNDTDDVQEEASLDAKRQKVYKEKFLKILAGSLTGNAPRQYSLSKLEGYVDITRDAEKFDSEKEYLIITNIEGTNPEMKADLDEGLILKNMKVIYVDEKGRASIIETDIRLGIPGVQYPTPSTLPDLMNMIVVANSGLIVEGNQVAESVLEGSVYAGTIPKGYKGWNGTIEVPSTDTSIWLPSSGNVSISNGERVVCRGGITVGNKSTFRVEGGTALWAEGITLTSSNVELLGKTYFSDDLTITSGSDSRVSIAGEYYGYGNKKSAKESRNSVYYTKKSDADLSSAIIVDGKGTTVDVSRAERIMVSGKSYLSTSTVSGGQDDPSNTDIALGESITVKGGQLAYLLPEQLMNSEEGKTPLHNPMTVEDYENAKREYGTSAMVEGFLLPLKWDTPFAGFGKKALGELGLKSGKPITEVYYRDGANRTYVYFYLNFSSDEKLTAFMSESYAKSISNMNQLNKNLTFYFGENSGVTVKDSSAYLRFVTNGNVLSYDGGHSLAHVQKATARQDEEKLKSEEINYQNTWYALNRKMIGSIDLLNTSVKDEDDIEHDETDKDRSVYDNLVNEKGLVEFIKTNTGEDRIYQFKDMSVEDGFTAIMAHNGISSTYQEEKDADPITVIGSNTKLIITEEMAKKLRLVVCTGDVEIEQGVTFRGIIMAKGTIVMKPGAKIISAPLEAAQIFQAQMNQEEKLSPQNFFWDGDRYVLGNSQSEGTDTDRDDETYHIEDYITYENWNKK